MSPTNELTTYEKQQVTAIKVWKAQEPSAVSKALGKLVAPLVWLCQRVVPEAAIRGALDAASWAGNQLADTSDILRDGQVQSISEMKKKDLDMCDRLADSVQNWAIGIAVGEGAVTGAVGLPGLAADIPVTITLALRTVHKIGLCYGYTCSSEFDHTFAFGVLSASSSNTMTEKVAALALLRQIYVTVAKQTWKAIGEKAAAQQLSKEGAIIAVKNLAKQLGINLTKRKAMMAIPMVGAGVGATVNGFYLKEVGWAARRSFQERWLVENEKIESVVENEKIESA